MYARTDDPDLQHFKWKWTLLCSSVSVFTMLNVKTHIFCMQKNSAVASLGSPKASQVIFYNLTIAWLDCISSTPLLTGSILQFNTSCPALQWNPEETELWPKLQTFKPWKVQRQGDMGVVVAGGVCEVRGNGSESGWKTLSLRRRRRVVWHDQQELHRHNQSNATVDLWSLKTIRPSAFSPKHSDHFSSECLSFEV